MLETERPAANPHYMRVMLTTNIDVDNLFANGTQGRLLCWTPSGEAGQKRRKIQASHPDFSCRFLKESSMNKNELLADVGKYF